VINKEEKNGDKMKMKAILICLVLIISGILIIPLNIGAVNEDGPSPAMGSRADTNNTKNDGEPIVLIVNTTFPPTNISNVPGYKVIFNITVTDDDEPPNGSYIMNATLHLGAITGNPTEWVPMVYNYHPPYNQTRKTGSWNYEWVVPTGVQPGIYDIMLNVSDSGNISDNNNHSMYNTSQSFSISIHQVNRGPTKVGTGHELAVDEDEKGFFLLDAIFADDDIDTIPKNTDLDSFTFEFWDGTGWSNSFDFGNYSLAVDSIGNFTLVPDDNWFNKASPTATPPAADTIMVRAYDSKGAAVTHNVTIKVLSMNDAPMFKAVADWTWNLPAAGVDTTKGEFSYDEDKLWTIEVMAMDNDTANPTPDTLQFSIDSTPSLDSKFDIDPSTGIFNFTPVNAEVGVYDVEINVSDDVGDFDLINITFDIGNTNDDPKLLKVKVGVLSEDIADNEANLSGAMQATQDIVFNFTVEAEDDDIEIGETDSLVFAVAEGPATSTGAYGKTMWNFTYTPDNDDAVAGHVDVKITVKDLTGSTVDDFVNITINIQNINDPPKIIDVDDDAPPADKELDMGKIKVGDYSNFTIEASDIDNDELSLDTETPMSYITITEIEDNKWNVSFKPNTAQIDKNITVNFSVSDRPLLGLTDYVLITWAVESGVPPPPDNLDPDISVTSTVTTFNFGDDIVIEGTWSDDASLTDDMDIMVDMYDSNATLIQISGFMTEFTDTTWKVTIEAADLPSDLPAGTYSIQIDLDDGKGGSILTSVDIEVKEKKADEEDEEKTMSMGLFDYDILIILIIIVVVILAAVGVIMSKKKKAAAEEAEVPPEAPPMPVACTGW
jgi:VCBS repeat-containing protein